MSTELSARDVLGCARDGAAFAAEQLGTGTSLLERVAESGRLDLDRYDGADRLRRELPDSSCSSPGFQFGMVGPTNHFIELQEVEEVFNPDTAAKLGVAQGQMTLQYHAGGGVFPGAVGAMFGRRKHYPGQIRAAMSVVKPLYHGMSARSLSQLRRQLPAVFRGRMAPRPAGQRQNARLMLANAAAMNYGFAFRVAIYAGLRQIATEVFGGPPGQLVVDSPHNSIYEEEVGGGTAVVHRHDSSPRLPGGTHAAGNRPSPGPARRCWSRAPTGRRRTCPAQADRPTRCIPPATAQAPWSAISPAGGSPARTRSSRAALRFRSTTPPRPAPRISTTRQLTRFSRC